MHDSAEVLEFVDPRHQLVVIRPAAASPQRRQWRERPCVATAALDTADAFHRLVPDHKDRLPTE
jgi:hypothetical protein